MNQSLVNLPVHTDILAPGEQFTVAELCAMALDGIISPIFGHAYRPVALRESPQLRASAIASQLPASVAERAAIGRLSAAWVYGCAPLPETISLLANSARRCSSLPAHSGCVLHEVQLGPYDVERMGGALLTSVLRTAVDVACTSPPLIARPILEAISTTASLNCPLGYIKSALQAARYRPGKHNALLLINQMLAGD